jgi:hypothetical protein
MLATTPGRLAPPRSGAARAAAITGALLALIACARGDERPSTAEGAQPLGAAGVPAAPSGALPPDHPPVAGGQGGAQGGELPADHPAIAGGQATPLPAPARAALDSANQAYRDKRYEVALAAYRSAARAAPSSPAPVFGIYMAAKAMGRTALADSAMQVIRARSGDSRMTDSALTDVHTKPGPKPVTQ